MSFDLHILHFKLGESTRPENVDELKSSLLRFAKKQKPGFSYTELVFSDGQADLYGIDSASGSFMINHISGMQIWNFLYKIAEEFELTLLVPGTNPIVTNKKNMANIPKELALPTVVNSSDDLCRAVLGST